MKPRLAAHLRHDHPPAGPEAFVGSDEVSRTLYLMGSIDTFSTAAFFANFEALEGQGNDPIRMVMHSRGGEVESGQAIYDRIVNSDIETYIEGYGAVQSIATLILQAGTRRSLSEGCRVMVHVGSLAFDGAVDQRTMISVADESSYLLDLYCEILAANSGRSVKDIRDLCDKESYFSAAEAVKLGLADEVISCGPIRQLKTKSNKKRKK
jgi:ATP-dependent protease ClpP protease subunit